MRSSLHDVCKLLRTSSATDLPLRFKRFVYNTEMGAKAWSMTCYYSRVFSRLTLAVNGGIVSRTLSLRLALSLFVLFAVSFIAPRPAAADSTTVGVTAVTTKGQTVTGSYISSGNSIGAWSFDLSALNLADISGSSGSIIELYSVEALIFNDPNVNGGTTLGFGDGVGALAWNDSSGLWNLSWGDVNLAYFKSVTLTPNTPTSTTPEPSAFLLFALGLALLAAARFRRRPSPDPTRAAC